jgi:hypothetical protein
MDEKKDALNVTMYLKFHPMATYANRHVSVHVANYFHGPYK